MKSFDVWGQIVDEDTFAEMSNVSEKYQAVGIPDVALE